MVVAQSVHPMGSRHAFFGATRNQRDAACLRRSVPRIATDIVVLSTAMDQSVTLTGQPEVQSRDFITIVKEALNLHVDRATCPDSSRADDGPNGSESSSDRSRCPDRR